MVSTPPVFSEAISSIPHRSSTPVARIPPALRVVFCLNFLLPLTHAQVTDHHSPETDPEPPCFLRLSTVPLKARLLRVLLPGRKGMGRIGETMRIVSSDTMRTMWAQTSQCYSPSADKKERADRAADLLKDDRFLYEEGGRYVSRGAVPDRDQDS